MAGDKDSGGALAALRAAFTGGELLVEVPERHMSDWLMPAGPEVRPLALLRPRSTDQVAAALRICHDHGVPVVPQGGLTGLAGGATPVAGALLLSLELMKAVETIDPVSQTMIAGAGAPLQSIQEAADAAGLMFPLDIGARGSCQIGGNLATNAGGNRVLRYGMARDLVLGLEAVLADGTVISSMNRMLKNNAGYDLKQLFLGTEGTLGVITRVVLRLVAKPRSMAVALCAFTDYAQLERFLIMTRSALGGALSAFEVMWPEFYRLALSFEQRAAPLADGAGAYALVEISNSGLDAEAQMAVFLEEAFGAGVIEDATVAQSLQQTQQIWSIRDRSGDIAHAFKPVGNFDVSVPTSEIGSFVETCRARLLEKWPGLAVIFFGHVVDGNLHLIAGNVAADDLPALEEAVYDCVRDVGGSISAEHGVGLQKLEFLHYSRSAPEIDLMRRLKACLDPKSILNPGKVLPASGG